MTFLDEPSACAIKVNLLANQKNDVTISTSLQVLQYLRPSTRVLTAKYSSTGKEVLDFDEVSVCSVLKKVDRLNLESDIGLHWKSLFLYEFTHCKDNVFS